MLIENARSIENSLVEVSAKQTHSKLSMNKVLVVKINSDQNVFFAKTLVMSSRNVESMLHLIK